MAPGLVTPGINDSQQILDALRLPERLDGLRVLDIGARDGFFSFECERRGAEVVAIDSMPPEQTGFPIAKELVGSRVEMLQRNVYELSPEEFGTFDLVLFLGVLYHLRDPMLALDRIWSVSRDRLIVETQIIDDALLVAPGQFKRLVDLNPELEKIPLMQFYPGYALNDDPTNVWAPNQAALAAMLEEVGFAVQDQDRLGHRGLAFAERREDWVLEALRHQDRATGSGTA
ncbi:MAG TPA: methyltransferase domain-containing protein [Solirubrobacterales bacterium]